jgi:hypothetical protein
MRLIIARSWLCALVLGAAPLAAQRFVASGFPDQVVLDYFQKLQIAIVGNNHATIAAMVHYPLMVNHGGAIHDTIHDSAELLKKYDAVFSPSIRQAIILEKQAKLFGNEQGVAIARGTVWIMGKCDRQRPPTCRLGVGSVNYPEPKVTK